MALEVDELSSLTALEGTRSAYEEVFSRSDERDIFLSMDWIVNWWKVYGEGRKMLVLEVLEDGRPVGYAPLMLSGIGKLLKVRILEFIGTGPSDRLGVLVERGRRDVQEAVWKHLDSKGGWDTIDLRDMREDGSTVSAMLEHFPSAEREVSKAPFIPILGDHQDYLASLSSNVRHSLNRLWRRFNQDHQVEFCSYHRPEDMDFCNGALLELNAMRWKGMGVSTLESERMKEFVKRTIEVHSPKGQIAFHMLKVKEVPVAVTFGFVHHNRYLYYLSGFNPEYSSYGPGKTILAKIIEECYRKRYDEMDFLRGDESYKYSFNPIDRDMYRVRVSGRSLKGGFSDLLRKN
jgi:CelD/BcsL family acetyltransferase involved in cellulose biosynthesis